MQFLSRHSRATRGTIAYLPVDDIHSSAVQPRQNFSPSQLEELAASIGEYGVLNPLTVRQRPEGYELVAGERRLRAAKLAGLTHVPCLETAADDQRSALLALVENLQRQDLHYFEEAAAIAAYLRQTGATQESAAQALGRSPSAVANKLRLLRLSPACREAITAAGLTERHARCLLRLEDESARLEAVRYITDHQLNVAQTEQYVDRLLEDIQSAPPAKRRTFILKDVRLFLNSVDRGLRLIREAGVDAQTKRDETEDAILLTIRIPKQKRPGA